LHDPTTTKIYTLSLHDALPISLKTSTSNNETNIDTTQTLIEQLQTQIDDLKSKTKQYYTLFEDSAKGVGTTIPLNDNLNSFDLIDRKSTRLNSSHVSISYAVFC